MSELNVHISGTEKSYPIFINHSDISSSPILEFIGENNYIVVFSEKVYDLYKEILKFPRDKIFILKDGEKEKNIKNYEKILNFALTKKLTRQDFIISVGGGVVGDLAGFVASTYMRGINFIQVPTTLLACTDSSVGGKTAINTRFGKNLIGAFYQPKAVFININFLKTLDDRQFKSGLGEVVKYALIEKSCQADEDCGLMNFLSQNSDKILAKDVLILKELVELCIKLKISVVCRDEKELGLRRILNFGHTYAHAIETITNYKKYTHGECVVEGILQALNLSFKLDKIDKEYKFLCEDLIKKFNFIKIQKFDKDRIINLMLSDKKACNDGIFYIIANDYASVETYKINKKELSELL